MLSRRLWRLRGEMFDITDLTGVRKERYCQRIITHPVTPTVELSCLWNANCKWLALNPCQYWMAAEHESSFDRNTTTSRRKKITLNITTNMCTGIMYMYLTRCSNANTHHCKMVYEYYISKTINTQLQLRHLEITLLSKLIQYWYLSLEHILLYESEAFVLWQWSHIIYLYSRLHLLPC